MAGQYPARGKSGNGFGDKIESFPQASDISKCKRLILFPAKGILVESRLSFTRFHSTALHTKSNNFRTKLRVLAARLFRCCGRKTNATSPGVYRMPSNNHTRSSHMYLLSFPDLVSPQPGCGMVEAVIWLGSGSPTSRLS